MPRGQSTKGPDRTGGFIADCRTRVFAGSLSVDPRQSGGGVSAVTASVSLLRVIVSAGGDEALVIYPLFDRRCARMDTAQSLVHPLVEVIECAWSHHGCGHRLQHNKSGDAETLNSGHANLSLHKAAA